MIDEQYAKELQVKRGDIKLQGAAYMAQNTVHEYMRASGQKKFDKRKVKKEIVEWVNFYYAILAKPTSALKPKKRVKRQSNKKVQDLITRAQQKIKENKKL